MVSTVTTADQSTAKPIATLVFGLIKLMGESYRQEMIQGKGGRKEDDREGKRNNFKVYCDWRAGF